MPGKYPSTSSPPRRTHFLWWCAAVICAIITVAVIITGVVVFVGYLVMHPRIPIIRVVDAHLDRFQYDVGGVLVTQVNIVVRSENDNTKAHASFSDFGLVLVFQETMVIARLVADPYEVSKNDSVDFYFPAASQPIPLNPEQMQAVDSYLKQDRVRFDLKGSVRCRWRIGLLGSVRFWSHLNCQLLFHPSNGTYIPTPCTSKAK
ncbi:hypothetical protein Tsubulata_009173 [Turnera subulata]|uniref:Late embryogenesis abundant protein LEA-2 subgroup domain-containing protein n=1 Tax=Turnera subulata TaxID=218843 RepID=A0A9Q0J8Z4_9ROSI|nr:hypothetical protein Tsubulata_009173 [Turnera subulata]